MGPDLSANSIQGAFDNWDTGIGGGTTYWSIASEITSVIDMLEQTGAALVLAEPRLSARWRCGRDLTMGGEGASGDQLHQWLQCGI